MRSFVGKTVEAITLKSEWGAGECGAGAPARESRPAEFTEALTDNYLKLHLKGCHEPNRWLHAQVEDVIDGALEGAAKHADSPSS